LVAANGAALALLLLPLRPQRLRPLALSLGVALFLLPLFLALLLVPGRDGLGGAALAPWLGSWNLGYFLAMDGVSLTFVVLSSFLTPLCVLLSWEGVRYRLREFLLLLFLTQALLVNLFLTPDLLLFYVLFEAVVVPTFLLIGLWGSRLRRIGAAYRFFLYTLAGSLVMLVALARLHLEAGTLNLQGLLQLALPLELQRPLWLALFLAFAIKIPMVPFHIWLPEAHGEAPTAGSVLLAGVLLKLGGYGLFRFTLPLLPEASVLFTPLVFTLSLVAVVYGSLSTLVQVDLKKAIAYSSVAHMNYATLGLFSGGLAGVQGSLLLMVSHGLVSPGLFFCVGLLYDRYGSRLLRYYGGLAQGMPLYATALLLLLLANLSLPGTSSFVAEFLVLVGTFGANSLAGLVAAGGVVLSAAYSVWLYNRLCYGPLGSALGRLGDLNRREGLLCLLLLLPVALLGVYPQGLLPLLEPPCLLLLP
jgi:NADH-quinone oxidoreductase subunit M